MTQWRAAGVSPLVFCCRLIATQYGRTKPSMQELQANLYDFPKYYDLVFGSDWKEEFDFLEGCFDKHAQRTVKRLFEPACGTGRLMYRLAKAGYEVAGNDLNSKAVEYCNARLKRSGFPGTAVVGDMADFRVRKKFDAAFNMINSFRHLPSEASAESHLNCIARALVKGGLYVLGLHLTPTRGPRVEFEEWAARRGNLTVVSQLWSEELNRRQRNERIGMTFDIWTPTKQFRIVDETNYRTYTREQFQRLLSGVRNLKLVETYDFRYEIDQPIRVNATTEDVVFVLRRK